MGRKRTIDRAAVLDAAECVVQRDGTAKLTLEAVAAEAGISKASVLYDYKTKPALMRAMVERRIAAEELRMNEIRKNFGSDPNAMIRTHIVAAAEAAEGSEGEIELCLSSALAQDRQLREPIHNKYAETVDEIHESASKPRGALLAFLALGGLRVMERFDVYHFSPEERIRVLEEINWLVDQEPEQVSVPKLDPVS
ncbi:TetR/AcrR family transcriptional regulator [Amorphus sp. 3PC139-8]|uniref:TetR/AcrR family transcriptional regulator n=1 Tax=Amorphus sp. 3PC139-8 TaxID=2735676 RepID=UPI00345CD4FB